MQELTSEQNAYVRKIKDAVKMFIGNDDKLLVLKAHEQAMSHRIAVYLEDSFKEYDVDCEYNKKADDFKTIYINNGNIDSLKQIRPDIIVHSRGNNDNNLIVIEIKKVRKSSKDEEKLKKLTSGLGVYKYRLGVFILFKYLGSKKSWDVSYKYFGDGTHVQISSE